MSFLLETKNRWIVFAKLVLPFLLWIFLFRDFVFGAIAVNIDSNSNYAIVKFFLNSLRNGVVPLWDPFVGVGQPFLSFASTGVMNPLLTLPMLGANVIGVPYYAAYLIYIVSYYFVGVWGFYLLARLVLKDEMYAYLAYLLLLFSGLGIAPFNQVNMLLIFVPAVWFFFFLCSLAESWQKSHFVGLTFCLMLVMVSYLPFYFVTLFLIVVLFVPQQVRAFWRGFVTFAKRNVPTLLFCLLGLAVSCLPLVLYKSSDAKKEEVAPSRHCNYASREECLNETFYGSAEMSYAEASGGGLAGRVDFGDLFWHQDKVSYAHDGVFFLPFFCYLVLAVALFTVLQRQTIALIGITLILGLVALVDVGFLYRPFYDYVFYFKYFRNFFFFMAYLMPLLVLVAVLQLKTLLQYPIHTKRDKKDVVLLVGIIHLAFYVFLWRRGDVLFTSYLTILGSCLFFTGYFLGWFAKRTSLLMAALCGLILLQPLQFYGHFRENAASFRCDMPQEHERPQFAFHRPAEDYASGCKVFAHVPSYIDAWHRMMMRDSSGRIWFSGYVPRWVFYLSMTMDHLTFLDYAKNKLIVYDAVAVLDEGDLKGSVATLEEAFRTKKNLAFVADGEVPRMDKPRKGAPLVITADSDQVKIDKFDMNELTITTGFATPKFLVYNDSFNSAWRAAVNDRPSKLYRANLAYKGVYLPAGRNVVHLEFQPPGGGGIYLGLMLFYYFFFGYFLWSIYYGGLGSGKAYAAQRQAEFAA